MTKDSIDWIIYFIYLIMYLRDKKEEIIFSYKKGYIYIKNLIKKK